MNNELKRKYQSWAKLVDQKLKEDNTWSRKYADYANLMLKNEEQIKVARSKFNKTSHIFPYLTIGGVTKGSTNFSLRYLGQIIGEIRVSSDKVFLYVDEKTSLNNTQYFGCELGTIHGEKWTSNKASQFRKFFKELSDVYPRQKEHLLESALFSEMEKRTSANKSLPRITTIKYANTRIHMKTAVSACKSSNGRINVGSGGEIDLFCRRNVRPGESRIVVIEIKDENKKSEGFNDAIMQAISYAVFIKNLIHSDSGVNWMKLWGMQNQSLRNLTIDAVVAMPVEGVMTPDFEGIVLDLQNDDDTTDQIALHYIGIAEDATPETYDGIEFKTSIST